MRNLLFSRLIILLSFSISIIPNKTFAQILPNTAVKPNSTQSPSAQNNKGNLIVNSPIICDYTDVRIFPSVNPQSEIHLSIYCPGACLHASECKCH